METDMPIRFSRVEFATLSALLLLGGSIVSGSTQGRDSTPAAVGCDGAGEYVEAFQTAVREALSDSEGVLDNPASATAAELAEAADGQRSRSSKLSRLRQVRSSTRLLLHG